MTTRVRDLGCSIIEVQNSRSAVEELRRFKPEEPVSQIIELELNDDLPPRQTIKLRQHTLQHNSEVLRHPTDKLWIPSFAESSICCGLLS